MQWVHKPTITLCKQEKKRGGPPRSAPPTVKIFVRESFSFYDRMAVVKTRLLANSKR